MSIRSMSAVLPLVLIVVVVVVVFGESKVLDTITGLFSGGETKILGEGDSKIAIADGASSELKQCTASQMLQDRRCGVAKIVVIDAARMPFIARNITLAWGSGRPFELTKNKAREIGNRAAACGDFKSKYDKGSCDEYAFGVSRTQREGPV